MRRRPPLRRLPLLAVLAALPACGGYNPFTSSEGRIQVTVFTDGGGDDLAPGIHLITLKDVVEHCRLEGGNPQPFTVVPGKSVRVNLTVNCGLPPTAP